MKLSQAGSGQTTAGQLPLSFDSTQCLLRTKVLAPPSRPGLMACLDRFDVLEVLGIGGMGVVLAARDTRTRRKVALKLLRPELIPHPRVVAQFLAEARHMARLRHPHILPVLEVVDRPEGPYYVMPLLRAGSLARQLCGGEPLTTARTLAVAQQVAAALCHAHSLGLIHRDLKPDNVLLDEDGRAHLADFGLVRTLFSNAQLELQQDQYVGTAAYMSPAVASGQAEDTRCDIYAFGALLYELLTGQPPYQGRGTHEVLHQIREGPPQPIARLNRAADPRLVLIVEGAMARALRDRYATMADVLDDLERVGRGRDPRGPRGRMSQRPAAGQRWRLAAAFAATALLAAGLGAWLSQPLPSTPFGKSPTNEPHPPITAPVVANATQVKPGEPRREQQPTLEAPLPARTEVKPRVTQPSPAPRLGQLRNQELPGRLRNESSPGVRGVQVREWSSAGTSQRSAVQLSNLNGALRRNEQASGTAQQRSFRLEVEGREVRLSGTVTPAPKQVDWEWGDGKKERTQDVRGQHLYEQPGEYTIRLKLTDARGAITTEEVRVATP